MTSRKREGSANLAQSAANMTAGSQISFNPAWDHR
jgi:hypothetical protein